MSKYTGPFDANYKTVVDTIKGFIEFSSTRQLWNMVRRTDAPSTEEGESEQRERLSELLARGAHPNLWNYNGKFALHLAVQSQNDLAVPMLVWEGAELNLPDGDGETALQIAVAERMKDPRNVKSEEIYQILRQTGAIMNAREGVHQPPKQEDLEPLTSSYYIRGIPQILILILAIDSTSFYSLYLIDRIKNMIMVFFVYYLLLFHQE